MDNAELTHQLRGQVKVLEEKVKRLEKALEDLTPTRYCLATGIGVGVTYCRNNATKACKCCTWYMEDKKHG